jgi:hypothetical protein
MTLARPAIAFCALVALAWLWRRKPAGDLDDYEPWKFV